ncbi:glycoside hydrolase/deacetylase [Anaeromyces robustus]|uniref:Glycoside hydrolase/deacetylase n=1 Tax=Anaeromyces robustus TaxID=1754192 RepID=A0A1Y1X5Q5_9FUNG|nr:glycoside hydrolase/deacetylase [Anaeromyces robustus]|eukprot:ORX80696.1 glycoside hydrolase/deacetylase [Anaeromyces robustus]
MLHKINFVCLILGACIVKNNFVNAEKAKVYTSCLLPGQFALTFDDGPNPKTTPKALKVLEKYNIKGTFFINAENWSSLNDDPEAIETVRKIYTAGHDIGSHTYYHKDCFEALKDNTLQQNIDDMTDKIESIIGVRPSYFRPPNGNGGYDEVDKKKKEMSNTIRNYLGDRGYNIIMWGTDTRDWQYKENVNKVIETLNEQLADPKVSPETDSFITLLHDVYPSTVNTVLPAVIEYIQKLGYKIVPLSECIGVPPYQTLTEDEDEDGDEENENEENEEDINEENVKYLIKSTTIKSSTRKIRTRKSSTTSKSSTKTSRTGKSSTTTSKSSTQSTETSNSTVTATTTTTNDSTNINNNNTNGNNDNNNNNNITENNNKLNKTIPNTEYFNNIVANNADTLHYSIIFTLILSLIPFIF